VRGALSGARDRGRHGSTRSSAVDVTAGEADCLLGKTWGYDDTGVWVSDGCSAEFIVVGEVPEQQQKAKPFEHIPNVGFLLYDGEKGQIYFGLFSYGRYLNQRNIDSTAIPGKCAAARTGRSSTSTWR
jgi:hypothetical protein